jgi:hypothetical protein
MVQPASKSFIRPCPPDFVETYLRIGWDGIEDHYRAHKHTIKRWVQECGGDELKALRREAVRETRRSRAYIRGRVPEPVVDGIEVDPEIVTAAAQHLRHPHSGGWIVSPTGAGDWRIGTMRKSPAELVEMAGRKGFDIAAVISVRRKA